MTRKLKKLSDINSGSAIIKKYTHTLSQYWQQHKRHGQHETHTHSTTVTRVCTADTQKRKKKLGLIKVG